MRRKKVKVQWVRRNKMRVQWTVIPPNAQATEGLGWCQSEAGTAERIDHPAERVRHGWRTPDFQANREWGAQKVPFTELRTQRREDAKKV